MDSTAKIEKTAELYYHTPNSGSRKSISYRRFADIGLAVTFAVENISPRDHHSCFLEVGEARFGHTEIRELYDNSQVELRRKQMGGKA
jgi:hypothetical protein